MGNQRVYSAGEIGVYSTGEIRECIVQEKSESV